MEPQGRKRISLDISEVQLKQDLERYKNKALDLSASRAKIIRADEIPVDERVKLKCQVPRCYGYGMNTNCPPNTLKPAELRTCLEKYKWAIFFCNDIPSENIVRNMETTKELIAAYVKVTKIVAAIESMAFYDGYYLAVGFGAGTCRHSFCLQEEDCQTLKGNICRFAEKTRPSMEAVGIDVFKMVASAGWDIYPIGSDTRACDVQKGVLAGIVIVQ